MARWRASIIAVVLTVGALGVVASRPARAAGAHRALVIVDTGATTYRQLITFDGDSVTGVQALQLAGANPVVYTFAGQGGAVCRLFGVGRDAGPNCLGGPDPDPRYWAYFRAPSGTSTFTYSGSGAGSVAVHDGDVEGWKFGTGEKPVWSPVPPTTTTTAPAPPPPNLAPVGPGPVPIYGSGSGSPGSGATGVAPSVVPDSAAAVVTSTTAAPTADRAADVKGTATAKRGPAAAGRVPPSGGSGGDGGSLVVFAIVVAGLGAGVVYLRRARRTRAA